MALTTIKHRLEQAVSQPGKELSHWVAFARFQIELWRYCGRRLHENNLLALSAALSFRTIFAMIPLLVLSFLMLRSIGVVEDRKETLYNFIEQSGFARIMVQDLESGSIQAAPEDQADEARRISVGDYIVQTVDQVESQLTFQRIGPVGAVLLIWTALTLFTTLEASLNRIFEARKSRSLTRRIVLFWSVLTLGPIAVMVTLFISNQAIDAVTDVPVLRWFVMVLGWLGPVLVSILAVAMIYMLVPNTHVKSSSALAGALISVPLWLVARWLFAVYVQRFVLAGNLYGVLGLLPLFLLWLNVSWSVFLFGGQLAYTATNLKRMRMEERSERLLVGPSDWIAVLSAIARPHVRGEGPPDFTAVTEASGVSDETASRILDRLGEADLVCMSDSERQPRYLLTRPPDRISLHSIMALADPRPPMLNGDAKDVGDRAVGLVRERIHEALQDRTLADLLEDEPRAIDHVEQAAWA